MNADGFQTLPLALICLDLLDVLGAQLFFFPLPLQSKKLSLSPQLQPTSKAPGPSA